MNDIEVLEELKEKFIFSNLSMTREEQKKTAYAIAKLLKERQSDKERIKELEEERDEIYEDYQYLGKEKWKSDEAVIFLTKRLENTIPKSLIKEKIEELKKYRDIAKELIEEKVVIADSDSLNYGRAEAHDKDIQVLEELLKGE